MPLMVVIHDVAPVFCGELEVIVQSVRELIGSRFACAIVPRWKGTQTWASSDLLLELVGECDECMLHGYTHHRQRDPGLVSRLTGRSDEFAGLSTVEIQQRIDAGRDYLARETGISVTGLLPPAWQMPCDARSLNGVDYLMRFRHLESCTHAGTVYRLATWSFDWGWLRQACWCGELLGQARWKLSSGTIPCVAIHPADVTRNWLPRILRLIRTLIDQGHQPTLPRELLSSQQSC